MRAKANGYLQLADREQVLRVLDYWAFTGCSLGQALVRQNVPKDAFWNRVRRCEPEVRAAFEAAKVQWSFSAMDDVLTHANETLKAHPHPTWGLVRQKQVQAMARALAPAVWTEKGQLEAAGLPQAPVQAQLDEEVLGPKVIELRAELRQRLLARS